jgi:hypothetical protein
MKPHFLENCGPNLTDKIHPNVSSTGFVARRFDALPGAKPTDRRLLSRLGHARTAAVLIRPALHTFAILLMLKPLLKTGFCGSDYRGGGKLSRCGTGGGGGVGGAMVGGMLGMLSVVGALVGASIGSTEASTMRLLTGNRCGVQLAAAEGRAKNWDTGLMTGFFGAGAKGLGGGYSNTLQGKVLVASFMDSYNQLVKVVRS